jgi:hypothetical protein
MSKISLLPEAIDLVGSEQVVLVKDGVTRRAAVSGLVGAAVAPALAASQANAQDAANSADIAGAIAQAVGAFETAELGILGTDPGQTFWTRNPPNLYRNDDGVAVLQAELATMGRSLGEFDNRLIADNLPLKETIASIGENLVRDWPTLDSYRRAIHADDTLAWAAARAAGHQHIQLLGREYVVSDAIELWSGLQVVGRGSSSKIRTTGANKRVFWAAGKENISIESVFVEGNLTGGVYNPATGGTGGDGLFFFNCKNVTVTACWFDKIGQDTTAINIGASCIAAMMTDGIKVTNCAFLQNNVSVVGADINCAYYVRNAVITGNISLSEHDHFFSGPAVSVSALDTSCHTVTGNIARRSLTTRARSGIIADYGPSAYATVSGNIMVGFNWNGVYVSAPQEAQNGGCVTVSGNIALYCGGGSNGESGISAGFYLSGKLGNTSTGNIAIGTGYKADGSSRLAPVSGFLIVGASRATVVAGCIARNGRGYGLEIRVIGGTTMDGVNISGFQSYDNAGGHILIDVQTVSSVLRNVVIANPILRSTVDGGPGIRVIQGDTGAVPDGFQVLGGQIVGPGKATSTQAGFYTNAGTLPKWKIRGVLFSGWATGVDLINGAIDDKEVGDSATLADCDFDDCAIGISMGIDAGKYAMIERCTFTNCTNNTVNPGRIITSAVSFGQDPANPSKKVWHFYRPAVPNDGTWARGSVCYLSDAGPGDNFAMRVTNPAGAGTWTPF